LLIFGGAGILLLVIVLNCSSIPPFVSLLSVFGQGCVVDHSIVTALAFPLFGLWVVVMGVPILVSPHRSKQRAILAVR